MDANRVATVTARLITIARVLQPVNGKFFRIIDEAAGIIQILQARVANTADSDRLQSALAAAPVREERVVECFCETDAFRLKWLPNGRSFVCLNPCWLNQDTDEVYFPGNACPVCCAELGDGIARRWKERE